MCLKYNCHGKGSTAIQSKIDIEGKAKDINRMGIWNTIKELIGDWSISLMLEYKVFIYVLCTPSVRPDFTWLACLYIISRKCFPFNLSLTQESSNRINFICITPQHNLKAVVKTLFQKKKKQTNYLRHLDMREGHMMLIYLLMFCSSPHHWTKWFGKTFMSFQAALCVWAKGIIFFIFFFLNI